MKRSQTKLAALLGFGALAAVGCHGSRAGDETSAEVERRIEARGTASQRLPERVPATVAPITGEAPVDLVARVREDLVRRIGRAGAEPRLLRDQSVRWNDGSLGCPQPGEVYPQVEVTGYWIVFVAGEREYDYRSDDKGHFRLCVPRRPSPPAPRDPAG